MRFMRRSKEPAIARFGGAERLLRSRPVASHDPVLTIAAYASVSAHFTSPAKFGLQKTKAFGSYGEFTPCRSC